MKFICIKAITMIKDLQALANVSLGTLFYKLELVLSTYYRATCHTTIFTV